MTVRKRHSSLSCSAVLLIGTVLAAAGEAQPCLDLLGGILTSDLDVVLIDLLYGPAPRHNISCWTHRTSSPESACLTKSFVTAVIAIWCYPLKGLTSVHDSQVCGAPGSTGSTEPLALTCGQKPIHSEPRLIIMRPPAGCHTSFQQGCAVFCTLFCRRGQPLSSQCAPHCPPHHSIVEQVTCSCAQAWCLNQVPRQVSLVVGRQWRGVLKVSRPVMCMIPSFCTLLLLSLPQLLP